MQKNDSQLSATIVIKLMSVCTIGSFFKVICIAIMRETKKKNDKSLWAITTEGRRESNEPITLIIQSKYMKLT